MNKSYHKPEGNDEQIHVCSGFTMFLVAVLSIGAGVAIAFLQGV